MALPWDEIETPNKVRQLQRTLYREAKGNGRWRAWSLYGDVCRRDVLETALAAVVRKAGAAGVDGIGTEAVKAAKEAFLDILQAELREKRYRPGPVLRVWIPKADGKQRPLGIPTVCANCTQEQRVLGMGCDHASVPSVTRPTVPDSEDEDLFWAADGYLGGWGLRHVFGSSRMD